MQILQTSNLEVTKYIHDDGSETAIKFTDSCNHDLNNLNEEYTNRKKYTIFISTSVGCFMKCKFCHLTLKNAKFIPLSEEEVLNNLKEAITHQLSINPHLKNYFVKLSWMGMGDALIEYNKVSSVSLKLLDWIIENNFAEGLDGVDLSTVFPKKINPEWSNTFNQLNVTLSKYNTNPNNKLKDNNSPILLNEKTYKNRSLFRLFYSISSIKDIDNHNNLIPNTLSPYEVLSLLNNTDIQFNVLFHHLLLDNENDSDDDISHLINFLKENNDNHEFRVLRYNECSDSSLRESRNFLPIIKKINNYTKNIKVQISPGSEVKAACGQFIVSKFKKIKTVNIEDDVVV